LRNFSYLLLSVTDDECKGCPAPSSAASFLEVDDQGETKQEKQTESVDHDQKSKQKVEKVQEKKEK